MLSKMAQKSALDPAAKMYLALLRCGTYPRKLMVGWSQKKQLGLSKRSSILHFHVPLILAETWFAGEGGFFF